MTEIDFSWNDPRELLEIIAKYNRMPWPDAGKDFDTWFDTIEFSFGTKWIKFIARSFARKGWDAALVRNIK